MRRYLISAGLILALSAGGAAAYWAAKPPPPPPAPELDEQQFSEVDRIKYEQWMQSLGYTD